MNIKTVPLKDLKHPEKNVRQHPEYQINEMARSLDMFGQIRPVVVDETYTILAGNGMVMGLRQLGVKDAKVLILDNLSDADKKKVMLADNRIFSLGIDHQDNTMDLISSIGDFDIPGFDETVLQELLASPSFADDEIESYGVLTDEEEEDFKKSAESKERAIERSEAAPQVNVPDSVQPPQVTMPAEPAGPVAKVINCPHCNEQIWL